LPTYEYACTACGHKLEAVQSFSDDPLTSCDDCGGSLRKVYGNVGIVFKGSGFYKTDSRNGNGKSASSDPSGSDSTPKSDSSPTSDSGSSGSDSGSSGDSSSKKDPSPTKDSGGSGAGGAGGAGGSGGKPKKDSKSTAAATSS
jgi:putative FmdB family regulatory protein